MAAWQYDLYIVPRRALAERGVDNDARLSPAEFDAGEWWHGHALPADFHTRVAALLPPGSSWDDEWHVFGEEDGTRLDVMTEGVQIEEVRLRLDARNLDPELLERLMALLDAFGCALVTPEMRVLSAEPLALWVELELSPAAQYVRDPAGFLNRLRRHRDSAA